jgi:hypothetical protein
MSTALHRVTVACLCASSALLAVAPAADARKVTSRSATAVLPGVDPVGKLKPGERVVKISARSVKGAGIEVFLQIYCFDDQLAVHRRSRTLEGTGNVRGQLRRPRGTGLDCSANATVRVRSRPSPPAGERLQPIRLTAVIRAFRR